MITFYPYKAGWVSREVPTSANKCYCGGIYLHGQLEEEFGYDIVATCEGLPESHQVKSPFGYPMPYYSKISIVPCKVAGFDGDFVLVIKTTKYYDCEGRKDDTVHYRNYGVIVYKDELKDAIEHVNNNIFG